MRLLEFNNKGETFTMLGKTWDVDKGYDLVKAHGVPVETFNTSDLASMLGFVRVDHDHAMGSEKNSPVLIVELEKGLMLIDGYHRVHQAVQNKVDNLQGYVLDQEQSKSIELR